MQNIQNIQKKVKIQQKIKHTTEKSNKMKVKQIKKTQKYKIKNSKKKNMQHIPTEVKNTTKS